MKILLFAGIAAVAVGIVLIGLYVWTLGHSPDDDTLYEPDLTDPATPAVTAVRIQKVGDENGCSYSWEARMVGPDKVRVTVCSQPTFNSREKVTKRTVGLDVLTQIAGIVEANGMAAWDDLPRTDLVVLDAATVSMSFVRAGEEHRFSDSQEVPGSGWVALWEIAGLIEEAAGVK